MVFSLTLRNDIQLPTVPFEKLQSILNILAGLTDMTKKCIGDLCLSGVFFRVLDILGISNTNRHQGIGCLNAEVYYVSVFTACQCLHVNEVSKFLL